MKILLDPTVTVVGHSVFVEHREHKIPSDGTDAEKVCSFAAKSCYNSFGEAGRANIENQRAVISSRHGSCLQHATVSLNIEGITRACSLELNRHGLDISQKSTRYTKEEDSAIVLEPYYAKLFKEYFPTLLHTTSAIEFYDVLAKLDYTKNFSTDWEYSTLLLEFIKSCEESIRTYAHQVDQLIKINPNNLSGFDLRKWARGKARNVLCHALETSGVWTANHRMWRWIIELRSAGDAEPEIRRLANHILEAVRPLAPTFYEDFEQTEYDGINEWKPRFSKI